MAAAALESRQRARTDPAGNIWIDKKKPTGKVDGPVSLVMALGGAMISGGSGYDHRGLLFTESEVNQPFGNRRPKRAQRLTYSESSCALDFFGLTAISPAFVKAIFVAIGPSSS